MDDDARPLGAPLGLLSSLVTSNSPWGLGLSREGDRFLVVYATLGSEAAFTSWVGTSTLPVYVPTGFNVGELDGILSDAEECSPSPAAGA